MEGAGPGTERQPFVLETFLVNGNQLDVSGEDTWSVDRKDQVRDEHAYSIARKIKQVIFLQYQW